MNRTDSRIRVTSWAPPRSLAEVRSTESARLVVVISYVETDAVLAGKILSLARERSLDVLLLGVANSFDHETELRRRLITLAAFVRDGGSRVEIQVDYGRDWIEGLKIVAGANDLLACGIDDMVGEARELISDTLSRQVGLPVYIFSTPRRPEVTRGSIPARLAAWAGSVAIILVFIWLQLPAAQAGNDSASTALLLLSLPVEIALIWIWNSLWG